MSKRELKCLNYNDDGQQHNTFILTTISDKGLRKIISVMKRLRADNFADDFDSEIIKDLAHGNYYKKYLKVQEKFLKELEDLDVERETLLLFGIVLDEKLKKLENYERVINTLEVDKKYKDNIKIKEFKF